MREFWKNGGWIWGILLCISSSFAGDLSGKKEENSSKKELQKTKKVSSIADFIEQMEDRFGSKLYECQRSEDCMLVEGSVACNCNNGGRHVAIQKKFQEQWNGALKEAKSQLDPMMCAMSYNCQEMAICKSNRCQPFIKGARGASTKPFKRPQRSKK